MNHDDSLLGTFVSLANEHELEVGLTLTVGGTLVTGTVISIETYTNELASDFETAGRVGKLLAEGLRGAVLRVAESKQDADDDSESDSVNDIIHLKDAKIFTGDSVYNVGLWRGKISSVDGFTVGTLND